jgi:hypothetical protein
MLIADMPEFNYVFSTVSGFKNEFCGIAVNAGSAAHAKNANVIMIMSGIQHDCYGINIHFASGSANGATVNFLANIHVDPNGGTQWGNRPLIENLAACSPDMQWGGDVYYFPLYIKAGSTIGVRLSSTVANRTCRIGATVYGKPTRPELVKAGTYVTTFGALSGTTLGSTVFPGNAGVSGAYTHMGTASGNLWWWQVGHMINDTSMTALAYNIDVAVGDANNKTLVMRDVNRFNNTAEQCGKDGFGSTIPFKKVAPGTQVYARVSCFGTADSANSCIVYGVGG